MASETKVSKLAAARISAAPLTWEQAPSSEGLYFVRRIKLYGEKWASVRILEFRRRDGDGFLEAFDDFGERFVDTDTVDGYCGPFAELSDIGL